MLELEIYLPGLDLKCRCDLIVLYRISALSLKQKYTYITMIIILYSDFILEDYAGFSQGK